MDAKTSNIGIHWMVRVSIHAPVMDAKDAAAIDPMTATVSIHAPVMDANLD